MTKLNIKLLFFFFLIFTLSILNCGGATQVSIDDDSNADENVSETTSSNAAFIYNLTLTLDSSEDDWDLSVFIPQSFTMGLDITNNQITLASQDVPKMVYRVCATDSTTANCDTYSDKTAGVDIDLVIDSCGRFVEDEDCDSDTTTYSGTLNDDGSVIINNVSIRIRNFMVTDNLDGYSASDTATGLIPMNRLVITLTTDTVASGNLSTTGSNLNDNDLILVAAGTISSASDAFPGANYTAELEGILDFF